MGSTPQCCFPQPVEVVEDCGVWRIRDPQVASFEFFRTTNSGDVAAECQREWSTSVGEIVNAMAAANLTKDDVLQLIRAEVGRRLSRNIDPNRSFP